MSTPTGESWDAKFDGKEYPVKGVFANETVSLKKMNDRTIEATYRRDGKPYSIVKMTVSADGKQMTIMGDNKLTGRVSTYTAEKQSIRIEYVNRGLARGTANPGIPI